MMYTLDQLKRILGLQTTNQVRNRIEAIRDLLEPHMRRGPNNRIILDETGLGFLQALQSLCDSGKTLKEAAKALREEKLLKTKKSSSEPERQALEELLERCREEVRFLRELLRGNAVSRPEPWWREWIPFT